MKIKLFLISSILFILNSCQYIDLNNEDFEENNKITREELVSKLLATSNIFEVALNDNIIVNTKSNKSSSDTLTQVRIINEHIKFVNNQWQMNISLEEANKLGVSSVIYNEIAKSIVNVNTFIIESIMAHENRLNQIVNVPKIKRSTKSGGGNTPIPIPNPPIKVYERVELEYSPTKTSFSGPYKIMAIVGVLSVGVWAYTIQDEFFNENIYRTGTGFGVASERVYEFIYPLVPQNGRCSWRMIGIKAGADYSRIIVTYRSNL